MTREYLLPGVHRPCGRWCFICNLREKRHQRVRAYLHDGRQVELDQRVALLWW